MKPARTLLPLAAVAALAATGSALAAPTGSQLSAAAAATRTPLAAKVESCTTTGARSASFRGSMPAISRRGKLEMRFDLYERAPGGVAWTPLPIASFGEWSASDAGVSGFVVRKRVGGLQPGVSYRAVVRYRWRAATGKVVRQAKRITPACRQPDTRADLVLRDPSASAGKSRGLVEYRVVVRNIGRASANLFNVVLNVNGADQPAQRLGPVNPGGSQVVTFQAARCTPGSTLRLTVDAGGEVLESDEGNNVLQRVCTDRA